MLCSCIARFIQSDRLQLRAMCPLRSTMKGATSIESSIAASTGCMICGLTNARPSARASSTKPNSPHTASASPVRSAAAESASNNMLSPKMSSAFIASSAISNRPTQSARSNTTCKSSSMPMVTKNSPSSTSRNGLMSASTW